ncbi:MAG TPA: chemotaxis protein CheB [Clostridiaceae bacterium]|nr:chemotaxis protein CheB [Clostridiaceae bacterium]HHV99061.1 chemotaxis protein CheB [Clostridiaceae bacterium]
MTRENGKGLVQIMTAIDKKINKVLENARMTKNILLHTKNTKFQMQNLQKSDILNIEKNIEKDIEKDMNLRKIVAIGASTGGPKSLQEIISKIPGDIPAAFLIVQHMPSGFTKSLAERLNSMSELTVKEAEDGDIVNSGHVYIAPGNFHMLVEITDVDLRIRLSDKPPVRGHRPSIDVMLNSLSDTGINNIIAIILTGMGADGSEGIVNIKKKNNGFIIAQDEKTSVVYGMPKAALETGVVDFVVPLHEIASQITKIVGVF